MKEKDESGLTWSMSAWAQSADDTAEVGMQTRSVSVFLDKVQHDLRINHSKVFHIKTVKCLQATHQLHTTVYGHFTHQHKIAVIKSFQRNLCRCQMPFMTAHQRCHRTEGKQCHQLIWEKISIGKFVKLQSPFWTHHCVTQLHFHST